MHRKTARESMIDQYTEINILNHRKDSSPGQAKRRMMNLCSEKSSMKASSSMEGILILMS
jgi:hypothetical protein